MQFVPGNKKPYRLSALVQITWRLFSRMVISFSNLSRLPKLLSRTKVKGFDLVSFGSYAKALEKTSSEGYGREELVKAIVSKTLRHRDEVSRTKFLDLASTQTLLGLVAHGHRPSLRVLDFGGGAGIHYFQTVAFLGAGVDIRWSVVETPEMVAAASAQLETEHLKFFRSIESAVEDLGKVELVIGNSSLPYSPDPLVYLEKLLSVQADHLYITRTPLGDDLDSKIYLQQSKLSQNGPGPLPKDFVDGDVQYPITIVNRQAFEQKMKNQYSVRFWSSEASSPFLRGVGVPQNYSYFLDLINLNSGVR